MGRILSLDYGQRRVGVAMSDPLKITAQPYTTWKNRSYDALVHEIRHCINEFDVELILIGLPLTLRGERGPTAFKVDKFVAYLSAHIDIPVRVWDERLTTVQAHRVLHSMEKKPSQHKAKIDQMASVLLLQNYLEFLEQSEGAEGEHI